MSEIRDGCESTVQLGNDWLQCQVDPEAHKGKRHRRHCQLMVSEIGWDLSYTAPVVIEWGRKQ